MLYEPAARADEVLRLNGEDLYFGRQLLVDLREEGGVALDDPRRDLLAARPGGVLGQDRVRRGSRLGPRRTASSYGPATSVTFASSAAAAAMACGCMPCGTKTWACWPSGPPRGRGSRRSRSPV
jgi:hypothetical protein